MVKPANAPVNNSVKAKPTPPAQFNTYTATVAGKQRSLAFQKGGQTDQRLQQLTGKNLQEEIARLTAQHDQQLNAAKPSSKPVPPRPSVNVKPTTPPANSPNNQRPTALEVGLRLGDIADMETQRKETNNPTKKEELQQRIYRKRTALAREVHGEKSAVAQQVINGLDRVTGNTASKVLEAGVRVIGGFFGIK